MMGLERFRNHSDETDGLDELVRAAAVCGCATCRHAVRVQIIKDQAHEAFTSFFETLTKLKVLSLSRRGEKSNPKRVT